MAALGSGDVTQKERMLIGVAQNRLMSEMLWSKRLS